MGETVPEIKLLLGPNVLGKSLTGTVERLYDWLMMVWLFKLVIQTNVNSRLLTYELHNNNLRGESYR